MGSDYYEKNKERILAKNYAYEKRRLARDPAFREAKREQARRNQKKRRGKHRAIKHAALDRPCADCGVKYPPEVMDFDHVRGEKLFDICHSTSKSLYVSYEMLHAEIAKCDVRCANCHRLRHLKERDVDGQADDDHR